MKLMSLEITEFVAIQFSNNTNTKSRQQTRNKIGFAKLSHIFVGVILSFSAWGGGFLSFLKENHLPP